MGRNDRPSSDATAGPARAVLLGALALAVCLFGWRAVDTMTEPVPAAIAGSAQPGDTLALLETVTGPGKVRLATRTQAPDETGQTARHFLLMIDGAAPRAPDTARLEAILAGAAGYAPEQGDTLHVDVYEFAPGASARPAPSALIELAGLAALCALLGGLLVLPRATAPAAQPSADLPGKLTRDPGAGDLLDPMTSPAIRRVSDLAARDPAGAAQVLRRWMRTGSDAA